ncbi:MAG: hypothetical protein ACR2JD_05745 [Nocardioides sp.]
MKRLGEWAAGLLAAHPRQPDQRSCGASVLVVERALRDEGYARLLVDGAQAPRFREEALGMHRRTTGLVSLSGRLQAPWPRALGTPPWAIAGQLSASRGPQGVHWGLRRAALLDAIVAAVGSGVTVPLYVGSRWLPRHVVLIVGADAERLSCYEPSSGRLQSVTRHAFRTGSLGLAGWSRPWCAVLPTGSQPRRRTPA